MSKIIHLGQLAADSPVLDLGCGTGRFAIPLRQTVGAPVYALDRAGDMIGQAVRKEGSQDVRWTVGDAQALPYAPGSFAGVFLALVIPHLEDRPRPLAAIHQALEPGGRLVIWTASQRQISEFFLGPFFPSLVPIDLARFPPIETLLAEMRAAGFVQLHRQAVVKRETIKAADASWPELKKAKRKP